MFGFFGTDGTANSLLLLRIFRTKRTPLLLKDAVVFATGFHVLSAHAALLPPDVGASIGTGRAAVGSIFSAFASRTGGAVSFWTGAVRGHATLWFVVPSLPFFLVLPAMLERNINFWLALLIASAMTIILYLIAIWFAGRLGIDFK